MDRKKTGQSIKMSVVCAEERLHWEALLLQYGRTGITSASHLDRGACMVCRNNRRVVSNSETAVHGSHATASQ